MSSGPAFLRRCVPVQESPLAKAPPEQAASWKDAKCAEEVSSWRLGNIQDSLSELMRQQVGLQAAVHDIAEMQQELRKCLQQSQQCLEQRLHDLSFPPLAAGATSESNKLPTPRTSEAMHSVKEREPPEPNHERVDAVMDAHHSYRTSKRSPESVVRRYVQSPAFDLVMGSFILLNFVTIYLEVEMKAEDIYYQLGQTPPGWYWPRAKRNFNLIEAAFNAIFLLELCLRVSIIGRRLWRSPLDCLDALVIVVSAVDSFILETLTDGFRHTRILGLLRVARILRALRLLRFLRVLRLMALLSPLRVLVHTIAMSMDSLLWSLVVMGCIIICSALLMTNLVTDFLEDERQDLEDREWVFMYFGSATRASYTMFEATFSGIWASRLSRTMINKISPWFMLYWSIYVCTVNFAVLRVISALFLKRTLDVAQIDAERIIMAKATEKEKVVATIREVFKRADQVGDGVLHRWEFEEMMETPELLQLFEEVELEPPELWLLYNLLGQDGEVDQEEFLAGAMKLKSQTVKPVDIIRVMHEQFVLKRHIDDLKEGVAHVDQALHPKKPWQPRRSRSELPQPEGAGQAAAALERSAASGKMGPSSCLAE